MGKAVIVAENISKIFRIGSSRSLSIRESIAQSIPKLFSNTKNIKEDFHALSTINFEIQQGTSVGIIGRNGAGKSTLLKILSRITKPTTGKIVIEGRVASLLEVGTGFHPELTGRENIFLNGVILGMKKNEIQKKFDEIVDFSGIEKFIDTPVKRYSSGMYVRLGFAVAAHLEQEILIVDEVLAVGDIEFQKKCLGKMNQAVSTGKTILFVSHNMQAIRSLCTRAILIEHGNIIHDGEVADVIEKYIGNNSTDNSKIKELSTSPRSAGYQKAITQAWVEDSNGNLLTEVPMGSDMRICFKFSTEKELVYPAFGFGIENSEGQRIFSAHNYMLSNEKINCSKNGVAVLHIPEITLLPGQYWVSLSIVDNQKDFLDFVERGFPFTICFSDVYKTGRIPEKSHGNIYVKGKIEVR